MGIFQMDGKALMIAFIGAIIALAFMTVIADATFFPTTIGTNTNETVTGLAVNVSLDLTGRDLVTATSVTQNDTSAIVTGAILSTGTSSTTGLRSVQLTLNDTASGFVGKTVNVTYTYKPDGYLNDLASRSVLLLVILFAALGVLIFVIATFIKLGSLGELMRTR